MIAKVENINRLFSMVYIPSGNRWAKREKKREAEVIRELVSKGLKTVNHQGQESTGDSLLRLAAIGGKAPADLSTRIDDYLYGEDH